MLNWIKNHFNTLHQLQLNTIVTDHQDKVLDIEEGFNRYIQSVLAIRSFNTKLIFIGNGGSAGIASHLSIDYSKNGQLPSLTLSDASAITCLSNDFGYEFVFSKQIQLHARNNDILIAISSSGKSKNILNAVEMGRTIGCKIITFSGFEKNNPLSRMGDLNFYVESTEYGFVEVAHVALGHAMLDYIVDNKLNQLEIKTQQRLAAVE